MFRDSDDLDRVFFEAVEAAYKKFENRIVYDMDVYEPIRKLPRNESSPLPPPVM